MKRLTLAVVAALLVLAPLHETVRATPPQYTVEDLGTFNSLVPHVTGVNASGQVVGYVDAATGPQAVRYTNGPGWEAIPGVDGGGFSVATGINAAGDVVGYYVGDSGLHPFRYRDGTGVETIAFLEGGMFGVGMAINDAGTIVGASDTGTTPGIFQAFRQDPGLLPVALPSLNGGTSIACGVNASGVIVGYSATPEGLQHGMRINLDSTVDDIAPPDGATGNVFQACAIDTDGVVGGSGDASAVLRAFRSNGGAAVNLDTFAPLSVSSSVDAIASGLSVGWYQTDPIDNTNELTMRAFAHRDGDGSFDLNTRLENAPGWVLNTARGVNANGVIVGNGQLNGVRAAYRLTVFVPDTTPPVIQSVLADPSIISPADNRVVPVAITVSATDNSGAPPVCSVTGVTGGAAGDASVTGALSVEVKAKSAAVYTVSVRCVDAKNNFSDGAASVTVVTAPPPPTDTTAPVIRFLRAQRTETKIGGVKWELVRLFVWATDNTDQSPFCSITSITGGPAGSFAITGRLTARLRELKSAGDLDRVYHVHMSCVDNDGNAANATVNIDPNGRTTYTGDVRRWHW
jgi:hypothetical protein